MSRLVALITKELRLLTRDMHGLLVLFAMPAVFVLIMSFALQDAFEAERFPVMSLLVSDQSGSPLSRILIDRVGREISIKIEATDFSREQIEDQVRFGQKDFALIIPASFAEQLVRSRLGIDEANDLESVEVLLSPTVQPAARRLMVSYIKSELIQLRVALSLRESDQTLDDALATVNDFVDTPFKETTIQQSSIPLTSVQQSVPAWLIFGMFFVVIPLSTVFVEERQQGMLTRLRVMNVSGFMMLSSKLVPYYAVNQAQLAVMLLVGCFVVPMLGGRAFVIGDSPFGLMLIASAVSFAAMGLSLLVAMFAKTILQATAMGGVANILFAAIGGIMVPKFVMPDIMQQLTLLSPMGWALEGFLDLFVRGLDWHAVLPECGVLILFGSLTYAIALWVHSARE